MWSLLEPLAGSGIATGKEKPSQRQGRDTQILELGPDHFVRKGRRRQLKGVKERPDSRRRHQHGELGPPGFSRVASPSPPRRCTRKLRA